jgi:hypothetical protein
MRGLLFPLLTSALCAATFNFDNLSLPTVTPFSDTNAGITANFTTPDPTRCFSLSSINYEPGFFFGNILYDCHIGVNELDIMFNENLAGISLLFETLANTPQTFTLAAFSGGMNGTQVGVTNALGTASGTSPSLWSGPISFSGVPFDSVKLTSAAFDWAIDQINVVPVAEVPESETLGLVALAFVAGGFVRWKA